VTSRRRKTKIGAGVDESVVRESRQEHADLDVTALDCDGDAE
jgi:hypothetical protein